MDIRSISNILDSKLQSINAKIPINIKLFSRVYRNEKNIALNKKSINMQQSIYNQAIAIENLYGYKAQQKKRAAVGQAIVDEAMKYIGNDYKWGGNSLEEGVDCSGFTQQIFKKFGIDIERTSYYQSLGGEQVSINELIPGDLLYFETDDYAPVTHVGIYIGDNKFIHSSNKTQGIKVSSLNWHYRSEFVSANRYY